MLALDPLHLVLLGVCLLLVGIFEFVNGFHDSANAVAPVIYTNSLSPKKAILISAVMNCFGVIFGGIGVAMAILHLLPLETIAGASLGFGVALITALLLSAIIWNLGTWYLGLPASSSHTMIGSMLGVSFSLYLMSDAPLSTHKALEVFESLLFSPVIGFGLAFLGMMIAAHIASKSFFRRPTSLSSHPPRHIRVGLIGSSALVSYMHGSNDGQKGVGLALLILLVLAPGFFSINPNLDPSLLRQKVEKVSMTLDSLDLGEKHSPLIEIRDESRRLTQVVQKPDLGENDKIQIRKHILSIQRKYAEIPSHTLSVIPTASASDQQSGNENLDSLIHGLSKGTTEYAPWWIILFISTTLGLGTTVGWRRIVVTIGEKIGKEKLNYAQATTASFVTAGTIGMASYLGLPVSTTHVMSSGVAGTMSATHGKGGLQGSTIRNIALAWILTLPISFLLAAGLFHLFLWLFV